ncbi:FIG01023306: hypothetical protein [hydrothermal vent metagenome]|uniref:Uncharacterized protein n=1 Tax=hydrothermal vent metagenome TaxID=652676 RepID=A0A3B0ST59_9ZZZZ
MTRLLMALVLAPVMALAPLSALAQDETAPEAYEAPMTLETLDAIIMALDPEAQTNGFAWQMTIAEITVIVITDEAADRMRAMAFIREAKDITPEEMTRMMQANFDSALDARYAIAQSKLWAAFIHPLSPLEKDEFISGLGQVVNLATSYGTLYSGGALQYGGGDSGEIQRKLIDELLEKGEEI